VKVTKNNRYYGSIGTLVCGVSISL
jgi:hypothetical protein